MTPRDKEREGAACWPPAFAGDEAGERLGTARAGRALAAELTVELIVLEADEMEELVDAVELGM